MTECESVRGKWGEICPDCGQMLPKLRPWSYGRPCSKTALDRGYGWDGRPAPEHTEGVQRRWATVGYLTERQQEVLRIVAKHGGNHREAAAELGIARATVTSIVGRAARSVGAPS